MKNLCRLYKLVPEYRKRLIAVVIVSSLISLGNTSITYLFKLVIDAVVELSKSVNAADARAKLVLLFAGLLAIRLVMAIARYINERLSDNLWIDGLWGLRRRLFDHITKLSIDYYETTRAGEIIERIQAGSMEFNRWINTISEGLLSSILSLLFIFVILLVKLPIPGMMLLVTAAATLYMTYYKNVKRKPLQRIYMKAGEQVSGELNETISHIATVRSFGQEQSRLKKYDAKLKDFRNKRLDAFKVDWNANLLRSIFAGVGIISSVGLVSFGALKGRYTAGDILLISLYAQQVMNQLDPFGRFFNITSEAETYAERIIELLDVKPTVTDREDAEELERIESIEFKKVAFAYPGKSKTVLENISFKLDGGKTLALVGISGAGKTTITKLLLRFYEPTEGEILVNGRPIQEFTQTSIRQHFGMVMQDVALFNATVEDNILFAKPDAEEKEMLKAAQLAHADVFIDKLPDGYKTLVGERGIKLSGGEKQRVAIARAILKNPEVVILDEATSSLDSQSEQYVQDGLRKLLSNRISVKIAHRLSTVMQADEILVLKSGKVEQRGTHKDLVKAGGLYAKLFKIQAEGHKAA